MAGGSQGSGPKWQRYRRPGDSARRNEDGAKAADSSPSKSTNKSSASSKPSSKTSTTTKPVAGDHTKATNSSKKIVPVVVGVIGMLVVIGIIAGVRSNDGPSSPPDIDTEMFDVGLIETGIREATEESGRDQAISLRLSEYELSVEIYDPNTNKIRTVSKNSYSDGYTVRVEDNLYDDYRPQPFDLSDVDAELLIDLAQRAIKEAGDPYRFDVEVRPDSTTGKVEITATADVYGGDGDVEIVTDIDGNVIPSD